MIGTELVGRATYGPDATGRDGHTRSLTDGQPGIRAGGGLAARL